MTIRKKLILLFSGLLAIVIMLFGLVIFSVIRSTWIETVDSTLRETTDQVISNSRSYPIREFGAPLRMGVILPQLNIFRASGVMVQAWSINTDGTREFGAASDNLGDFHDPLDTAALGSETATYTIANVQGTDLRVLTSPIRVLGEDRVFGSIQVAASMETINAATQKMALLMVLFAALAMFSAFMLGTWLSNLVLKPVEALTTAAASISSAKDLRIRLSWNGPMDELGRLTSVFNTMMDRIEHLFGVQQRLVADVSHELRTPITTIRGNLDLAKRYGMDAESLEAIECETQRMQRLVNDLLLLARADNGSLTLEMAEVDLDSILGDVQRDSRALIQGRDLRVQIDHLEAVRVKGNADRLKQLILNLLTNAIKFTPDGGEIRLSLRPEKGGAALRVTDTGVGIQPEDLPQIFYRFYRADHSRTRGQDTEGSGLGLAIAYWIAQAHGGTIEVESTPGMGTTFCIRLPLLCAPPCTLHENATSSYSQLALQRLGFMNRKRILSATQTPAESREAVRLPELD
jgi:signal transduction histidine kinase